MPSLFLVGGTVRDMVMGKNQPKDQDFVFVLSPEERLGLGIESGFMFMKTWLVSQGHQIKVEVIKDLTIRTKSPDSTWADFSLATKVCAGRDARKPITVIGSLMDDLHRRDLTFNAMAKALKEEEIIDPFGGAQDIQLRLLRTPPGKSACSSMII